MRAAFASGTAAVVRRIAHTLSGTIGIFGAAEVVEAAHRLEQMVRSGDSAHAAQAWTSLEASLGCLASELEAYDKD